MSFTAEEKVSIRHHLGYLNVGAASTFALGVPQAVETQFIIEGAFDLVLPEAEHQVRRVVSFLDGIEERLICDLDLLAVNKVGSIEIRQTEMKELRKEYDFWRGALANVFGIIPNPYDKRPYLQTGAGSSLNIPVHH